jgi:hypothetical protein
MATLEGDYNQGQKIFTDPWKMKESVTW